MLQIREVELSQLGPWEDNPRLNDQAVDAVAKSIQTFGFNVPILCDQDFTIIAGHTRWKAAKKLELTTAPVITLKMTDAQRRAFSIADNKTAEIADWDFPKLRDVLEELRAEELNLDKLGFSDEELQTILRNDSFDEDELPPLSDKPKTKQGDIWELGNHRLLCGDSSKRDFISFLLDGCKIDHVFGGPACFNQRSYAQWNEYDGYRAEMQGIIQNCQELLKDGSVLVWHIANDSSTNHDLASHHSCWLEESGLRYLDTIAWVKPCANYAILKNSHIRRNRCYYPAFQWEALLVFQKPGKMPRMTHEGMNYMLNHQTNVWKIAAVSNQMKLYGHPAVSPVELSYRSLQAYTGENACVFEPFGGSGTTLIAAEKASRKAFVIERIPAYCDMIVMRWENMTGGTAKQIRRG